MFTVISNIVKLIPALFLAIMLNEGIRGKGLYRTLLYLPSILPYVIIGILFTSILNYNNGMLNSVLSFFAGREVMILWKDQQMVIISIIIAMVWQAIGYYMVMYMASMSAVPVDLYESASLDGAGRIAQFFQITLPLIWTNIRTTLTFFIISTINMAFLFVKAMVAKGMADVGLSFMYAQKDAGLYGYSMAAGVVIFLFSFLLSAMVNRVTKRDVLEM